MSLRPRTNSNENCLAKQEERNQMLANLLDNVNINSLTQFYPKDESVFKKKIDKLNYRFYLETEKYLTNKTESEKCHDQLFMILFKQISLYIQEIERLNILLREKIEYEKINKDKVEEINKREKEFNSMQCLINNLRATNKNLENRLNEKNIVEEKLKNELTSLERQIKFYKEKMQIELIIKKNNEMNKHRVTNRYNDLNTTISDKREILTVDLSADDISRIGNKKRNHSDNNADANTSLAKKTIISQIYENKCINELKREMTKSTNIPFDAKSPGTKKSLINNSDGKNANLNLKKSIIKDFKIIKNIKQQGKKGNIT
jgi:hypothetical protein